MATCDLPNMGPHLSTDRLGKKKKVLQYDKTFNLLYAEQKNATWI